MNKSIFKKVVSVIACASILAGYASISSAASINSGSSYKFMSRNCSIGNHNYSYNVSHILYDGCSEGAYLPGLTIKAYKGATVINICTVNTSSKSGSYYVPSTGSYDFKMVNNTGKHVSISFTFS